VTPKLSTRAFARQPGCAKSRHTPGAAIFARGSAVSPWRSSPVVLADRGEGWAARPGEQGGLSVFLRDGDAVLRTWSGYGPVVALLCTTDQLLDLTPLGRQDETVELLHHDKYE
jgi:predicted dithiol-disulfide oxidoreductase (DUF899 family)